MAVIEENDTKRQIMEKLDRLPPDVLRGVLTYVQFLSMDSVSRSLLTCDVDEEPLREDALGDIENSLKDPRPRISDEQMSEELGL